MLVIKIKEKNEVNILAMKCLRQTTRIKLWARIKDEELFRIGGIEKNYPQSG